jgi:hypothetical protein
MQLTFGGSSRPSGSVSVRKIGAVVPAPLGYTLRNRLRLGFLKGWFAKHAVIPVANAFGVMCGIGELSLRKRTWYNEIEREHFVALRRDGKLEEAEAYALTRTYWIDYGVVSYRVVTNAGVGFIVDAFQNLVELETMNYHGIGTGNNAESASDTALQTESTTALNPDNIRATGTQSEPASNQYRSVGTLTADAAIANTEHMISNQAATGGGICFDRSVYSVVNIAIGESIQLTYTLTLTSGG